MQSCMIVLSCCHREGQVTIIVQMGITVHTFGGSLLEVINCVTTVLYIQIVTDVVVRTVKNQRERELQTKVQICLLYHLHTPGNLHEAGVPAGLSVSESYKNCQMQTLSADTGKVSDASEAVREFRLFI